MTIDQEYQYHPEQPIHRQSNGIQLDNPLRLDIIAHNLIQLDIEQQLQVNEFGISCRNVNNQDRECNGIEPELQLHIIAQDLPSFGH